MKNLMKKIILILIVLTAIYRVTSSQSSGLGKNSQVPENDPGMISFKLYQNEPEEFKEVTNIKFDLFKSGNVNLDVYDLGGNLIENLVEGEMDPGQYSVYFKSYEGLTPGEYFYVLKVNGSTKIMKMIYSKI